MFKKIPQHIIYKCIAKYSKYPNGILNAVFQYPLPSYERGDKCFRGLVWQK